MTALTATFASINRDRPRQALNVILSIAQLAAISIAVATANGADLDSRSAAAPPVVPAEYAFTIWSFIYPACLAYAVYQALPAQRESALLRRIGLWTASAFLAMTLWATAVALARDWLTVAFIVWLLVSLLGAFIQFIRYRAPLTTAERFLVVLPVSVHTGWITVATIANTASVLAAYGFSDVVLSNQTWAVVMLVVAGIIGSFVTLVSRGNVGYALTVIWALIGIVVANVSQAPNAAVAVVAGGMAALVALALLRARTPSRSLAVR
jgi:hypothetical protein